MSTPSVKTSRCTPDDTATSQPRRPRDDLLFRPGHMPAMFGDTAAALIVDDDDALSRVLSRLLTRQGYHCTIATNVNQARALLSDSAFAIALVDVMMPGESGLELAAEMADNHPDVAVVMVTGVEEPLIADLAIQSGVYGYIVKPFRPNQVLFTVANAGRLRCLEIERSGYQRRLEQLVDDQAVDLAAALTDLQQANRELLTSANQLRVVTDVAPIGIFQTDAQDRYVYTNPRWSEITGIQSEQALGQTWGTVIDPAPSVAVGLEMVDGDNARSGRRFELSIPGSASRVVLLTAKSIPDGSGGISGWVGTLADVTAEAGAEAAMSEARDKATEASRLKSDFLANMSHEIRTPMNGVIGMTDLLLETDLDDRQLDYAQTVRNSGEALLTIINDILDFSKVEAGKLEVEDIDFELLAIVDDVVDLLARPAHTKGLELVAVVDDTVPSVVRGDPGRVRQVLTNLIGNAIKFTDTGEIVVRVSGSEGDGGDTLVRFEVSDSGVGIASDKLDLVFQPFVQADMSTSRKYGGTGLGLAISGQLVAAMGGSCGVASRIGEGSTFWFTISVHADAEQTTSHRRSADADLAGIDVLIVDDSTEQRGVLSAYLTTWGMTVTMAASGPTALMALRTAAAEGRPFSIAVIDHHMPGMDGMELTNAIDADPALSARVVLLTDLGQEGDRASGAAPGVRASLSKPVHRTHLHNRLRTALGVPTSNPTVPRVTALTPSPVGGAHMGRVLLAEDNLINQKVAVAVLSNSGYHVDTVPNGAAAVHAVAAQRYDAILMDCHMPELNGYEATAAIRAHEGSRRHTPIIAMTAGARGEDRDRCLAAGMDSYLAKPVSKDALLAMVAQSLKNRPAGDVTIDREVLDKLRVLGKDADQDFLGELVDDFVRDTEPLLVEMRTILEAGDGPAVGRLAHRLKGSCGELGGRRLASSCDRLERHVKGGSLADSLSDLHDIDIDFEAMRLALTAHASSPGGASEKVTG
jgi:PAS domain S-box-containing protein